MISIIIAVYNGQDYIEETVNSALNQTVSKEIILVDDCSKDDSLELVKRLGSEHSCIKVIKNEINKGFCKSVNIGLKAAKGEYVLVLGQDDVLLHNHCEVMQKCFDSNTSIVFCDYDLIDRNGQIYDISDHCIHKNKSIKDFYKDNTIPSVGLLMNRQMLMQVGGYPENEEFPQYGEYHTWIRMALEGDIVFCEDVRARYRRHNNNMTNNFEDKDIIKKLNKYFNNCKLQILQSSKVSRWDKLYVYLYMKYRSLKVALLER